MATIQHLGKYQDRLLALIKKDRGVDDISDIPFLAFDDLEKIVLEKVWGNTRLMNKKIVTVKESEDLLRKISKIKMP